MFKNYSRSYKYKVIKKNLEKCVALNGIDEIVTTHYRSPGSDTLPSTSSVQSDSYEPTASTSATEPTFHQYLSDVSDSDTQHSKSELSDSELMNEPPDSDLVDEPPDESFSLSVSDNVLASSDFLVEWSLKNNRTHTALSELSLQANQTSQIYQNMLEHF
ncbi:hypothetical protein JTB14_002813 [Gonioctena quinquepunctata]|nr:hypothetical protein JTB14_002813 [Gonioctena quinquepunctata]